MAFAVWRRGRWPPFFAGLLLGAALVGRINRPLPVASPTTAASPSPAASYVLGSHNATDGVNDNADITVVRVIDGDTVELNDGRRVRYLGIDTPEMNGKDCFAADSKTANERLVLGKTVQLERDMTETDRFGRLLRYVYVGDRMVNLALVADGFAYALRYPPDVRYAQTLAAAMVAAQTARRGLWSICSARDARAAPAATPPPAGCTIKGNINAQGEKIYHLPGCGSYEKTAIDQARGEAWFCTEAEATAAGWRQAGNCP